MNKYFKELGDSAFDNFFEELNAAVTADGATWLIPALKITDMDDAYVAYHPLYLAIKNKHTRTSTQVTDHRDGREVAETFIEGFANEYIIPNSGIAKSTKESLGFNVPDGEKHERPAIEADVYGKLDAQTGSRMKVICRTTTDASRASIAEDADGVEMVWTTGANPATWNECDKKEFSTKAIFTLELDPTLAGKTIYVFLRWRNNSDPGKSGPWSDKLSTTVRS